MLGDRVRARDLRRAGDQPPAAPLAGGYGAGADQASVVVEQGSASGGPGWYPDPLARFEHRYWDGQIWTEWVSTKGQLAIDTEPVPGYD